MALGDPDTAGEAWKEAYLINRSDPVVRASFSQYLANHGEMNMAVRVASGDPLE
jgi:hypothetical protein